MQNRRFITSSGLNLKEHKMQSTFGTERDPLIPSDDVGSKKTTSLPKWQLFNVYLVRAVEPLSNQVVYPFINQMLVSVGAADSPETVGYASGIVRCKLCCKTDIRSKRHPRQRNWRRSSSGVH